MSSARYLYALELMANGHPQSSAARAAGCYVGDLPSAEVARKAYAPHLRAPQSSQTPVDRVTQIMARVGEPYGVTPQMMRDQRRTRVIAWPRMAAMAAVHRELPRLSYPAIGRAFGGRDHTTILHGVRDHNNRMAWAEFLIWAGNPDGQLMLFREAA